MTVNQNSKLSSSCHQSSPRLPVYTLVESSVSNIGSYQFHLKVLKVDLGRQAARQTPHVLGAAGWRFGLLVWDSAHSATIYNSIQKPCQKPG